MKAATAYDPRSLSAYTYADAARVLNIPRSTLSAWKKGQDYKSRERGHVVFEEAIATDLLDGLSYYDLVEAFILRSLRTKHGYKLKTVREALRVAQKEYGIERLFLHRAFRHDGGKEFFLDRLNDLATLSHGHQLVMKTVLDDYLQRIEYAPDDLSALFRPVIQQLGVSAPALIVVNPLMSFGRPVVERTGIRTSAIVMRVDAGELRPHIIEDFGLDPQEFEQALLLEAA